MKTHSLSGGAAPAALDIQLLRGANLLWQGRWQRGMSAAELSVHVEHRLTDRTHCVDLVPYCGMAMEALSSGQPGPLKLCYEHDLVNVVEKFGDALELIDTLTVCISARLPSGLSGGRTT